MMKTLLAILFLLLPSLAQAEATCESLVITGHPSYAPVSWSANGQIVGAAPDLVSAIALKLGVKNVNSRDFGSWEKAQEAANSGQADVIFGIYKNAERAMSLNYIDPPFMLDPNSVIVRKGNAFPFAEWDDLKGRKGVTNAGESYGNRFDAFMAKELTVARAPGIEPTFDTLLNKQADYLIVGLYPGKIEVRRRGLTDKVEFLPKEITTAEMYVAFSKKSNCYEALKDGFAENIGTDVKQGTVKRLLDAANEKFYR
jgi:polar amino acid transport system substrate-binding protein